jgi:hypothetical protein
VEVEARREQQLLVLLKRHDEKHGKKNVTAALKLAATI